ncbi:MAG TPA: hypothetical protein VGH82_04415 [Gaiellaceae bacterium]|jgi:predicted negative regulator of RcsB-dependent stress response
MNEELPRVKEACARASQLCVEAKALQAEASSTTRRSLIEHLVRDATLTYAQLTALDHAVEKSDGNAPSADSLVAMLDQVVDGLNEIERHLREFRAG